MKNYNSFDLIKFLLSFLVIGIHTNLSGINVWTNNLCSIAVPVFFIISGFLIFKSFEKGGISKLNHYLTRIVKLYILYTIIYLPLTIYGFYKDSLSPIKSCVIFIRNTFLVGENFMSWPLWYLLGLIVATIIIIFLLKRNIKVKWIAIIGIAFMIFGNFLDYLHINPNTPIFISKLIDLYYKVFVYTRNGFFVGFGYVSIGLAIAFYEKEILKSYRKVGLITIISLIYYLSGFYFGLPIFATSFTFLLLKDIFYKGENSKWFRNMSTLIYFFHMYFVFLNSYFIPETALVENFIIASISTVCFCTLIIKLSKNKHFYFLNRLLG